MVIVPLVSLPVEGGGKITFIAHASSSRCPDPLCWKIRYVIKTNQVIERNVCIIICCSNAKITILIYDHV